MNSSTVASPAVAMRIGGGEGTGWLSSSEKCPFHLARMAV